MVDERLIKVSAACATQSGLGHAYLVSGLHVSMQLWRLEPGVATPVSRYNDETLGYIISGRAELDLEGHVVPLEAGDSWIVPARMCHQYRILEPLTAVVACSMRRRPISAARDEAKILRDNASI
ncbi:MAG: cupin domain-containing protein [Dehalococcoidia bacterium]